MLRRITPQCESARLDLSALSHTGRGGVARGSFHLWFARRRTGWWPTPLGWLCLLVTGLAPLAIWWFGGESYLSLTKKLPAEILVVEGWIGREALRDAATEFRKGNYRYVVTVGGLASERWNEHRLTYAEMAEYELVRDGVPREQIITVATKNVDKGRTHESARAVWDILSSLKLRPENINVFTIGPHARRSRLTFARATTSKVEVGVISWRPSAYAGHVWWESSERTKEFLSESVGFLYEGVLHSGRLMKSN